jgi:hypothetical protein
MALNDILGLGKILPIEKLIDVVSKSVGRISKPYFERKDIDTKAYEIIKLAEAKAEEMKIISKAISENYQLTGSIKYNEEKLVISSRKEILTPYNINSSIEERTKERLNFQETKKQLNIENVTTIAAEELKNDQSITDEPLNNDWITRFFGIVEDISDEEMQGLWGKILAGEIKKPNSYSLRSLELLKNLTKHEAETFIKVGKFAFIFAKRSFIYYPSNDKLFFKMTSLTFSDILLLDEIGLIQYSENTAFGFNQSVEENTIYLKYGNKGLLIERKANSPEFSFKVLNFTQTATELLNLINTQPEMEYIKMFVKNNKRNDLCFKICDVFKVNEENIIEYDNVIEIN